MFLSFVCCWIYKVLCVVLPSFLGEECALTSHVHWLGRFATAQFSSHLSLRSPWCQSNCHEDTKDIYFLVYKFPNPVKEMDVLCFCSTIDLNL